MYCPFPTSSERVTSSSGDEELEEEILLEVLVKDPIRRFLDTVATSPISLVLDVVLLSNTRLKNCKMIHSKKM